MLVRYSLAAKALATCLMATPACAPGFAAPRAQDHAVQAPAAAVVPAPTPHLTD